MSFVDTMVAESRGTRFVAVYRSSSDLRLSSRRKFKTKKVVSALAAGILFSAHSQMHAAVITAASALLGDVTVAVLSARDGDTVIVPAGTASWARAITISKAITLQGAGIGKTIIRDAFPNNAPSPQSLLIFNTPANRNAPGVPNVRLTGFEFQPDPSGHTTGFGQGALQINGVSNAVRVDHCKFVALNNRCFYITGAVFGVVDHCEIDNNNVTGGPIYVYHDGIVGPTGQAGSFGDGSWATATNLGSANAMYFEDDTFTTTSTQFNTAITDGNAGCRFVIRHCYIHNHNIQAHGSGSTGRSRSVRLTEIYQNTMNYTPSLAAQALYMRGGTGVCWGNTITGANPNSCLYFTNFRDNEYLFLWNGSDGRSGWDLNDTKGGPNGNGIYLSGTAGAGSSGQTLIVPGANFTPNQWVGYAVLNLGQTYSDGKTTFPNTFGTCVSSTSNSITVRGAPHPYANPVWTPGNRFEIRKAVSSLDTIGAGPGDYLGGGTNPAAVWLRQTNEPYYLWSNTLDGHPVGGTGGGSVKAGVNIMNNGTAPKPGYTPYVYPHPLVSGASPNPTPSAPQNLRISGP